MVAAFLAGEIETLKFCDGFEIAFNLDIDQKALTEREYEAFKRLFEVVIYYSPFPEERALIPNYRDDAEIRAAAEACVEELDVAA